MRFTTRTLPEKLVEVLPVIVPIEHHSLILTSVQRIPLRVLRDRPFSLLSTDREKQGSL